MIRKHCLTPDARTCRLDPWWRCRLPGARAAKSETDVDFRVLLDAVVKDLLAASTLPEWPAAAALLLRLVTSLSSPKGLQHTGEEGHAEEEGASPFSLC